MSRSACSSTTFFPARCPPGCSLVCCGQQITTLLPNASKPCTSTLRKLLPYAIKSVTVAMPHTMPSMVRKLRVTLRFSATQASRMISINISPESFSNSRASFVNLRVLRRLKVLTRRPHTAALQSDQSTPLAAPDTAPHPRQSLPAAQRRSIPNSSSESVPQRNQASAAYSPARKIQTQHPARFLHSTTR